MVADARDHDVRHTAASLAVTAGSDVKAVQPAEPVAWTAQSPQW
jgi:hypothetical protein